MKFIDVTVKGDASFTFEFNMPQSKKHNPKFYILVLSKTTLVNEK